MTLSKMCSVAIWVASFRIIVNYSHTVKKKNPAASSQLTQYLSPLMNISGLSLIKFLCTHTRKSLMVNWRKK